MEYEQRGSFGEVVGSFNSEVTTMAKSSAVKRAAVAAPSDEYEANDFVRQIGEVQRAIERADLEMNARLEEVKRPYAEEAERLERELTGLVDGLFAYASANKVELTGDGKRKSVQLAAGVFGWRQTPKAVAIKDAKAVLARLKDLKLERFIRTIEEPNKEAMLKEEAVAASVEGVTISQREEFFVKAAETKAEVTAVAGKRALKVKVAAAAKKPRRASA